MKREDIEKEYNKLVDEIEGKCMYDGRNTVDRYTCDTCGYMIHTTYKDKGVTPFIMQCTICRGDMYHNKTFDKSTVPSYVPVLDWYRPSLEQTLKMPEEMIEHVLNGGLILEGQNMNKKQIEKAAIECGVIGRSIYNEEYQPYYINGFADGADWRINSVWHKTDGRPDFMKECLLYLNDPMREGWHIGRVEKQGTNEGKWNIYGYFTPALHDMVKQWAYIEDLLPDYKNTNILGHEKNEAE